MYNFNYYTPTKVVFGKNTEDKCGELVKEQGCKKVMIHYGSGSVKSTGLLDKVKNLVVQYRTQDFHWYMKESSSRKKKE